jgi:prefoldin subunit 5
MKTKLTIAIAALGLFTISCGESAEVTENVEVTLEETTELGDQVDELNVEIEAIEAAGAEIDATINELDKI